MFVPVVFLVVFFLLTQNGLTQKSDTPKQRELTQEEEVANAVAKILMIMKGGQIIPREKNNDAGLDIQKSLVMKPEKRAVLQARMREIAKMLHEDAKGKGMQVGSLDEIEQMVFEQVQSHR